MQNQAIRRQYDQVIAPHYDLDPQAIIGRSLDRALDQLRAQHLVSNRSARVKVLDVGIGTGLFLAKLKVLSGAQIQPFGLDLSEKMIEIARQKMPDLIAEVDDAANLEDHFGDQAFDLICTHFITGFVPVDVLAPKIYGRLEPGGYWSLVGGTKAGFPALQAKANSPLLRRLCGGRGVSVDNSVCNPADGAEVVQTLEIHGFTIRAAETFEPALKFRNFDEFMTVAYKGGWLTPFVEALGLHRAKPATRWLLNLFFFPAEDHHCIEIVLAQKAK